MSKLDRIKMMVNLESIPGAKVRELEYTFYGRIHSLDELYRVATHNEKQEQWAVPIETDLPGKARIRAINGTRFILTTKFRYEGMLGCEEVECDISQDMFIHLKKMGKGGYLKHRFVVPVPGSELKWEIDVFLDGMGKPHPWVKVDLEVPNESTAIPKLPIAFDEFITHQSKEHTPDEQTLVSNLWGKEWAQLDREYED